MSGLDPLGGLRGLAAFHVMLLHYFLYSRYEVMVRGSNLYSRIHLQASVQMPLFFLLSGFSLALGYGGKQWSIKLPWQKLDAEGEVRFDYARYYRNRFARVAPIYYLSQIVFIPAYVYGQHESIHHGDWTLYKTIAFTLTCTNTWFHPIADFPFMPAAWTVNTLFFFYLTFPFILPRVQRLTDTQLARGLVLLFWFQLVPFLVLLVLYPEHFWVITANPLCRLPVFVMGVIAGVQQIRHNEDPDTFVDPNLHQPLMHDLLPWGIMCGGPSYAPANVVKSKEAATKVWRRRVDLGSAIIILLIVLGTVFSALGTWLFVNDHGQLYLVHLQLLVMVGLTRDQGTSLLSRLCTTKLAQFFGGISMTLYLLHQDIPRYLLWATHPEASYDPLDCAKLETYNGPYWGTEDSVILETSSCARFHLMRQMLPGWGILVLVLAVPSLSWLVHAFVEEPARRILRAKPTLKTIPPSQP